MNFEIHQPELEAMIQQRMATGRFQTVEDVLLAALKASPEDPEDEPTHRLKMNFAQFLLESPLHGSGFEFVRTKDYPHLVDL